MTKDSIPLQTSKTCGIYRITCVANGRFYIGSSTDIHKRFRDHKGALRSGVHHNSRLANAWNKYGEGAFVFDIIEVLPNRDDLIEREQSWIDALCAVKKGFNVRPIAESNTGIKRSDETRRKISETKRGTKASEETRRRLSDAKRGTRMSDESKRKLSEAIKGHPVSKEARDKLSKAHVGSKRPPRSEEHCRKISEALSGKKLSEEHKAKLSEISRGVSWSEKRRAAQKSRKNKAVTE